MNTLPGFRARELEQLVFHVRQVQRVAFDAGQEGLQVPSNAFHRSQSTLSRREPEFMRPPLRAKQAVLIHTPLAVVWESNQDLSRIVEYHPRVSKVDLVSGE